jgi:2-polyprenyl-3-methyl-5-hydroxy-6-metoxy-1,4-benzoquinol methylase
LRTRAPEEEIVSPSLPFAALDLGHARRRAKELLAAARAGDAGALARLPRRRPHPQLSDAQFAIATELGFASWPALVHALERARDVARYRACTADAIEWDRVERMTLVPFLPDGALVLVDNDGRLFLPHDARQPGEHPLADAPLRIALDVAGFRRQGTHPFATADRGRDVALWVDGARYSGDRPHNRDARWWTGTADAGAVALDAQGVSNAARLVALAAAARAALTTEQYLADSRAVLDAAYLAATTAEGGSGFGGTPDDWRDERSILCDAIDRDGTFLDVGCANGHLIETLTEWCAERGVHIEPYGVDISEPLAVLARRRLPQWRDRIWVGNALTWTPPGGMRFDFVHTLFEAVPESEYGELLRHLLRDVVAPGGRLILSHYNADRDNDRRAAAILADLGYPVAGETRTPVRHGRPWRQPSAWVVAPAAGPPG